MKEIQDGGAIEVHERRSCKELGRKRLAATHGLLSIDLAAEQGFDFDYYPQVQSFRVREDGRTFIVATPHDAT